MPTTATSSFNFDYYPLTALPHGVLIALYAVAACSVAIGIALIVFEGVRKYSLATRIVAAAFLAVGVLLFAGAWYYEYYAATAPLPVFSAKTMLNSLWENYKKEYVDPASGRTFDPQRANDTTSESEGYSMLRAVWMDDQGSFDQSWAWTRSHLQRNDHLFSWLYGKRSNGIEGIIVEQNGGNSASDADTDIALALVFAYSRWQNPAYLQAALPTIKNIWNEEVVTVNGKPYLAADNVSAVGNTVLINPSYFAPYAYRIFSTLDSNENWQGLIDTSYQILDKSIALPLDKKISAGLPPNWVVVNAATGNVSASPDPGQTTDFGYDAIRVPWRVGLDWQWNKEPRAQATLQKMAFLSQQWASQGLLDAVYAHDGAPVPPLYQSPATYGGTIGYFIAADPAHAADVYAKKLQSLYDPDIQTWKLPLSYYDSNIVWFGMALYSGDTPNLFATNFSQ